jgi:VanZ family protein
MFLKTNVLSLLWLLVIGIGTLTPGDSLPTVKGGEDKYVHILMFGVLMFLLPNGLRKQEKYIYLRENNEKVAFVIGILYALGTEFLQRYVPGRNFDMYDLLANIAGILVGYIIYKVVFRQQ